jgi:hypothetical protein
MPQTRRSTASTPARSAYEPNAANWATTKSPCPPSTTGLRDGDLIAFDAQHQPHGQPRIENGTRGQVTDVHEHGVTITLDGSGRRVQLASAQWRRVATTASDQRRLASDPNQLDVSSPALGEGLKAIRQGVHALVARRDQKQTARPPAHDDRADPCLSDGANDPAEVAIGEFTPQLGRHCDDAGGHRGEWTATWAAGRPDGAARGKPPALVRAGR